MPRNALKLSALSGVLPDLSVRQREPELMDAMDLEPARRTRALRALARINALSRAAGRVWDVIRRTPVPNGRPMKVLDVACGGGDVAISLAARARRGGTAVEVTGCDRSSVALDFARASARQRGVGVTFFQLDAVRDKLPGGFDLVCSSLFLHHLSDQEAQAFLASLARAGKAVLVQDLRRSRLGYLLAAATVRTLTRSRVVRTDGVRSVLAAFSLEEAVGLARNAGLEGARVEPCWPQRFALRWTSP